MINIETYRQLLYKHFSSGLNKEETALLQKGLQLFVELREENNRLQEVNKQLESLYPEPSPTFVNKVMKLMPSWYQPRVGNLILMQIEQLFSRVAMTLGVLLIIGCFIVFAKEDPITTDVLVGIETLTPEEAISFLE